MTIRLNWNLLKALEDCIAYITPKYEVCYEEVLKKNIAIDTIVVCNTDLNSIPQIIQIRQDTTSDWLHFQMKVKWKKQAILPFGIGKKKRLNFWNKRIAIR